MPTSALTKYTDGALDLWFNEGLSMHIKKPCLTMSADSFKCELVFPVCFSAAFHLPLGSITAFSFWGRLTAVTCFTSISCERNQAGLLKANDINLSISFREHLSLM